MTDTPLQSPRGPLDVGLEGAHGAASAEAEQASASAASAGELEAPRDVRRFSLRLVASFGIAAFFIWVLRAGALPLVPEAGLWRGLRGWTAALYVVGWSLVHCIRAARWQLLLAPLATLRLRRVLAASFLGFLAILIFPLRTGEVVRPMLIRDRQRLTVWAAAGTLGAERVMDGLVLSSMLFVALLLATPLDPLPERLGDLPIRISMVPTTAYLTLIAFTLALLGMLAFHVWQAPTRRLVERCVGAFSPRLSRWVSARLSSLAEGLSFLSGPRHALPFLVATISYWLLNAACTWLLAWGAGLGGFGFVHACIVTGVLAIGVLVPNAPGFFGAFQFSVYAALALFYPREQVLGQGALFVFLLYLGQMLVTVVFAGWAAWLGGLGRRESARSTPGAS